ncbi:hypothetical protein F2Q68_00035158 [Brassica cretica]|uniref:Uncharacterized protein n=1 Tax=Brassica cretica TaxID=69181 RepID=A0A8S9H1I8_BRACR|nr:hypothetical protein F2Q68_00035158 [Brassica cretica]
MGFLSGCAQVLIPVFDEACDGSSSNNFSSSVLIGYRRVVVLVSLTATSNIWFSLTSQRYIGLLKSFCGGVRRQLCAGWAQVRSTVVAARFSWIGTLYWPYPGQINAWFGFAGDVWPLLVLFVRVGRCFETLSELFLADGADLVEPSDCGGGCCVCLSVDT